MRVVWDARVIFASELRGMGTYAVNLLRAMGSARPELDRVLLIEESTTHVDLIPGLRPRVVGPSRGYRWQLWEQVGLPWHGARLRADVLHSPANTAPVLRLVPQVVTVHDAIPFLPEVADTALAGRYWRHMVPQAIRNANAVITVSETSRRDLVRVLGLRRERITVIPEAVGADVEQPDEVAIRSVLAANDVRAPYVLSLAAPARRKNTAGVIRVFARIHRTVPDVQLVLSGVSSTFREHVLQMAEAEGIPGSRLRLLGYVDARTRNCLYAGASVFLFLSLYEGFGLPILEAMRCGVPVLCSNRGSCAEVAGNAAVIVDPADEHGAADALLGMLRAPAADRSRWLSLGTAREQAFTWRRAAELTLKVYDAVAN